MPPKTETKTDMAPATNGAARPKEARVTTQVLEQIEALRSQGRLRLPANYSAENALNQAWLILQGVQDRDKKSIFLNGQPTGVVTIASIAQALTDMVIQGLNPTKKQCYFIVYGNRLVCQRSYFGDAAIVERIVPGIQIYWDVVIIGEKVTKAKRRTRNGFVTTVSEHALHEKRDMTKIEQVYVGAFLTDPETGEIIGDSDFDTLFMTIEQVRESWKKAQGREKSADSFHNQQPDQACIRTGIRRFSKFFINMSDDELLLEAVSRQEEESILAEAAEIADENANQTPLSLAQSAESVVEAPTATEPEKEPVAATSAAPAAQKPLDEYE